LCPDKIEIAPEKHSLKAFIGFAKIVVTCGLFGSRRRKGGKRGSEMIVVF
jgi:hypothetical protein